MHTDIKKACCIMAFLWSSALLTGCGPAVAAGAGSAVTTALYDKRPFKVIMQDQTIEHTANDRMHEHPDLKDTRIYVNCINHNVLLAGEVREASQRTQAYRLVQNIDGVGKVYNQIRVAGASSVQEDAKDVWLLTKVKATLFSQEDLRSGQVKVTVDRSTVYLMGVLPPSQQQLAIDTTRHIPGVQKVVTLFDDAS